MAFPNFLDEQNFDLSAILITNIGCQPSYCYSFDPVSYGANDTTSNRKKDGTYM